MAGGARRISTELPVDELNALLSAYASGAGKPRAISRQEYAEPGFWESRFQDTEGTFDWYATFAELDAMFFEFCPPKRALKVLMIGCGNSSLSAELHEAGYRCITNIDIAAAAVAKMESRYRDLELQWQVMDATAMTFSTGSFGLAVDKGTLDAMMCGASGPNVAAMIGEVYRTLQPGGVFLLVSHNGRRRELLDTSVQAHHGPCARWEHLELRRCRLSPQATLINILRSKLQGRPLVEAFRDPEMMREAAAEAKKAIKQMAFLEAFRLFKAKKNRQRQEAAAKEGGEGPPEAAVPTEAGDADPEECEADAVGGEAGNPLRQPFCWVYALRKPLQPAADAADL